MQKPVLDMVAIDILLAARQEKKMGDFLFPPTDWNEKLARQAVKDWATAHAVVFLEGPGGGINNVFMDGPHCLRGGGMTLIQTRVAEAMAVAMKEQLGGCSPANVDYYARENASRGCLKRSGTEPPPAKRVKK